VVEGRMLVGVAGERDACAVLFLWKRNRNNYAGSDEPLPALIKEKEPLWYGGWVCGACRQSIIC